MEWQLFLAVFFYDIFYSKKEMSKRDSLMRKFRKSKTESHHETFKRQRNKVNNLVKRAKNHYLQNQLNECANEPKTFWKNLKSIFPVKAILIKNFIWAQPTKGSSKTYTPFDSNL